MVKSGFPPVPWVMEVWQAFSAVAVTEMGVMGSRTVLQLHFEPLGGVAASTYGQLPGVELHACVPPGICQLVQ